jgi:hypothetical protein
LRGAAETNAVVGMIQDITTGLCVVKLPIIESLAIVTTSTARSHCRPPFEEFLPLASFLMLKGIPCRNASISGGMGRGPPELPAEPRIRQGRRREYPRTYRWRDV